MSEDDAQTARKCPAQPSFASASGSSVVNETDADVFDRDDAALG
jgi:hypothetical protein